MAGEQLFKFDRDLCDQEYRRAIESISANCGDQARAILLSDVSRFPAVKVQELAGTSPEYQRHVLGRAAAGDKLPLKRIAASLRVYETVAFREVLSRLYRADGFVRKEVLLLERAVASGRQPDRLADRLLTLELIAEAARRLLDLLPDLQTIPGRRAAQAGTGSSEDEVVGEVTTKLNAPAALGYLAKNVHDIAELQPTHRPTAEQRERAVGLTRGIHRAATTARDAARRAFGRADAACRVRPARKPTRRVITHAKPDGDAVAAAWLAERFLFAGEPVEVLFVERERVLGAYRPGDCLVDVGNTHDPGNLFFDHKPPAFSDRDDACAARLVWDRLVKLGRPVRHLKPLVDVVFAGDSTRERAWFQEEYAESRRAGFHKALAKAKPKRVTNAERQPAWFGVESPFAAAARTVEPTDADVYRVVRRWLDAYHRRTLTRTG
jgi:hypothetical protein